MDIKLTQQEATGVLQIISRTTFQGQEAEAIVMLKQKITSQLEKKEEKEEPVEGSSEELKK